MSIRNWKTGQRMNHLLSLNSGSFHLHRLPKRPLELLRAWDAADEYLLTTVIETYQPAANTKLLIFNDSFGALAVTLHAWRPFAVSDSYLSQQATRSNLADNGLTTDAVTLLNSLQMPREPVDFVLIKAPKTLAYLEDFLIRVQPCLKATTQIIVAGMVKNMSAAIWALIERLIGETTTSLAHKKARLIFATPNPARVIPENPYPVRYCLENTRYQISNHANVFSRDRLDIGTRFLLAHLPKIPAATAIVDLGCGNGVVGLLLAEQHPHATIHFVDESFMAVASAQENFQQAIDVKQGKFHVSNGLTEFASDSMDLIVCNPPFHQQHTLGDQIAWSLFKEAKRVLKKGGQLWVIGNRHLEYQRSLSKLFARPRLVAANAKFEIINVTRD